MELFWFVLAIGVGLALGGAALFFCCREKRTLQQLDRMLEAAIRGEFSETEFEESLLSAVETKMAHYLSSSTVSARNLREEKEKIKTLIADISHQTKTPIANVLLYAQLLQEKDLPPEGQACAAALEDQAEKLQVLIEALLKTSRLETGILALHPQKTALGPVLAAAVEQLRPKAEEKGITLTMEPTQAVACFDPKWTGEAVCNLLDNGVKYTPSGGSIEVKTTVYELFCRVDVTDTGQGLAEGEQTKVFRRFYRSPDRYGTEGVGIGLYLVRQIATGQGGYVKVTSVPGEGSTFSLFLPNGEQDRG